MTVKDQRVAIVTGAGSGIGKATSLALAGAGFDLVLVGRDRAKLDAVAKQLAAAHPGGRTLAIAADLADPVSAARIIDQSISAMGQVDVLVNNAATAVLARLDQTDDAMLRATFGPNVFGPALLLARLWPHFERRRTGVVVNVSSMATIDPFPGLGIYAASKAALESLSRSIVNEGREFNVRAFNIAPGAVETPMLRSMFSTQAISAQRTLDPAAIASVVVDCVIGRRDNEIGRTIVLPSP